MSHYYAIFTDRPLEEMLEKHPKYPHTWVYSGAWGGQADIKEGDSWIDDPNGADKLHLTKHYYFNQWGSKNEVFCMADEYLKRTGGKIYIIELWLSEDLIESEKISKNIEILDLKDVSERLREGLAWKLIKVRPYVIYEVVNSEYRNQ
ncbi:MAG: hypothetical protein FWD92_02915 [Methanomassiliicoccaceae archaeon]|nr:hypothetical protein [Methanomassiliicoccaceae archaeon]